MPLVERLLESFRHSGLAEFLLGLNAVEAAAGLLVFFATGAVLSLLAARRFRLRPLVVNLLLVAQSTLVSLAGAEWYYRYAVDTTDWMALSETARWFRRHVDYNSLGFRDVEHSPAKPEGVVRLGFVGDGFIHGYGVERLADLFPKVVEQALADEGRPVEAILFGQAGAGPERFLGILERHAAEMQLDFVVITHYMNDIEDVGFAGRPPPGDGSGHPPPTWLTPCVRLSAACNYWYYRLTGKHRLVQTQWHTWLDSCYGSPEAFSQHEANLDRLIVFLREHRIPFLFVVIPFLEAADVEMPYAAWHARLGRYFTSRQADYLDLRDHLRGEDPRSLTVNRFDCHANPALHRRIAGWLLELAPWRDLLASG